MESTRRIDELSKKLGTCIERARPYYEARLKAKEALQETQVAAVRFERANSAHSAAKEMVFLSEEGLKVVVVINEIIFVITVIILF
jgi:SH3-domain binding protein 5